METVVEVVESGDGTTSTSTTTTTTTTTQRVVGGYDTAEVVYIEGESVIMNGEHFGSSGPVVTSETIYVTGGQQVVTGETTYVTSGSVVTSETIYVTGSQQVVTGETTYVTGGQQVVTTESTVVTGGTTQVVPGSTQVITKETHVVSGGSKPVTCETKLIEVDLSCIHSNVEGYEVLTYDLGGTDDTDVDVEIVIVEEEEVIIQEQLPFSLCPGEFWADAIRTIYGDRHLLFGYSNSFEVRESETKTIEAGPMSSGVILEVGQGECETIHGVQSFKVNLNIIDFKMVNSGGSIQIEIDESRPAADKWALVAKNVHRVLAKFAKISNSLNWKALVAEFKESPVEFYKNYIEMFYPATFTISFNTKVTVDFSKLNIPGFTGTQTLLNKQPIWIISEEILNFPPPSLNVTPLNHIELVSSTDTTTVVTRVEKFETSYIFIFITQKGNTVITEEQLNTSLTFTYVQQMVTKYFFEEGHVANDFVTELPFPTEPGKFWEEAVKYVYGENHLLLGVTHSFDLKHGNEESGDAGAMLGGLTVKVASGTSTDESGKPHFELNLTIVDYKLIAKTGGIEIEYDDSRPGGKCVITAQDTSRIIEVFNTFTKRVTWTAFKAEYEQNRVRFYKKYLELFSPATISLQLNLKQSIDGTIVDIPGYVEKTTVINRETVIFTTQTVSKFPPTHFNLTPSQPIEFVENETSTVVVITVGKFDTTFVTPDYKDKTDEIHIQETIITKITYEWLREKVMKYIVTKLPFPANPAAFWAAAIKTIYGNRHLLFGVTDNYTYTQEGETTTVTTIDGPLHNGLVVEVGEGSVRTTGDNTILEIQLDVIDFKMVDKSGGLEINYNLAKRKEECSLVLFEGQKIVDWFNSYASQLEYLELIEEFYKSPVNFYKKHIHRFYPAVIQIGVNLTKVIDGSILPGFEGRTTLVTKESVFLYSDEILNFPPSETVFNTKRPIEFVNKNKPSVVVLTVEKLNTTVIHFTTSEESVITVIKNILYSGLTGDIVREYVIKYVITGEEKPHQLVSLPFPIDPSTFFLEAIKTLYGEQHVLFGITESFQIKGPDGTPVDFGAIMNGLTYKVKSVDSTTTDAVRIVFQVVDFKFVSKDGNVKISNDPKKPGEEIVIVVKNTVPITELFEKFTKPANWPTLADEYERSPQSFYTQYISLFFPADFQINVHLIYTHDSVTYVTKDIFTSTQAVTQFPPSDLAIGTTTPFQLVGESDSTVVVSIEEFQSELIYPEDKGLYDIKVIHKIFGFDLTYELVHQYVLHYIISQRLPFSLRPGEFWADAIKIIYGREHLIFGNTNSFKITTTTTTTPESTVDLGTAVSGLTFKVTDGQSVETEHENTIQVNLNILDFKAVSKKPGVTVDYDLGRPGQGSTLTTKDPTTVFQEFRTIFKETNFENLVTEYNQSPKKFYVKYVELFYPATMTFTFNVKVTIDKTHFKVPGTADKTLVNKEVVVITHDKVKEFPPSDISVITRDPIQLVVRDNPDVVLGTIEKVNAKITHEVFTEKKDVAEYQKVFESGLTYEFIRKHTIKYVGEYVEITTAVTDYKYTFGLPFPLCPGEFWAAAIKTIYGSKKLLLGYTESFKIHGWDAGSMFVGVVFHVGEGSCYDEGDHLQLRLQVSDIKMFREEGGIEIVQDTTRPKVDSILISLNNDKVTYKFNQFSNPMKWRTLSAEFHNSPIAFYKKHIVAYYPSVFRFNVNLKYTIDGAVVPIGFTGKKTFISKQTITFTTDSILNFPPAYVNFYPKTNVELVEKTNPSVVVTTIEKYETKYSYLTMTDTTIRTAVKKHLDSGLTIEFIREYILKYLLGSREKPEPIRELPFPIEPAHFWTEATKIVHGTKFVFFGYTQTLNVKGPNGQLINIGPMLNGITIQIKEVTQTLDKGFRLTFEATDCKVVSQSTGVEISLDKTAPNEIFLTVNDETKVHEMISQFTKPGNWESVVNEYNQNTLAFYEKYLQYFYPAQINAIFKVQYVVSETISKLIGFDGPQTFVVSIEYIEQTPQFPPLSNTTTPVHTFEAVDPKNPTTIVTVEKHETQWILPYRGDKLDIDLVNLVFGRGLTYEIVREQVTHLIIAKRLPFSLNPAQFFADAIRTIHGEGVLLIGCSNTFTFKLPNGKEVNVGPMVNGIAIKIGQGRDDGSSNIVVDLEITDLKIVNTKGGLQIQIDQTRPDGGASLLVENTEKVLEKFHQMTHDGNWEELIASYNESPINFYKQYIDLFYPATLSLIFNLKFTIDGGRLEELGVEGQKVFFNKDLITITNEGLTTFPPSDIDFLPKGPVELLDGENPETVSFVIESFKTIWTRPEIKDEGDRIILYKIITTGFTFEYLIQIVKKYIIILHPEHQTATPLPFSLCPGVFWEEAIKTIYGDEHFLISYVEDYEVIGEDGKAIDDGPLSLGLTVKVQEGRCESVGNNDFIKIKFDILDFKSISQGEKVTFEVDKTRKAGECTIEAKNVKQIYSQFNQFANPTQWATLTKEYNESQVEFYKKYLSIFYPATINFSYNLQGTLTETKTTLINKNVINVISEEILSFPPSSFEFKLTEVIEFVNPNDRTIIVFKITKFETTYISIETTDPGEIEEIKHILRHGITFIFIIKYVKQYILEPREPKIPELPFPSDPIKFWEEAITTLAGESDLLLGLSDEFKVVYTDGRVVNVSPLYTGLTFKNVRTEDSKTFELRYEVVDLKMVSSDGSLEIELDKSVAAEFVVVPKNPDSITYILSKFTASTNWPILIEEYNQSPTKFYTKYISLFYPATFTIILNLKFTFGGEQTLVTKEKVTIIGGINDFRVADINLQFTGPISLIQSYTETTVIATCESIQSIWIYPIIKDNFEITTIQHIITTGGLTYIFVREKVTKYIISQRVPFPLCPGEFFAEAIKMIYTDGHVFLGLTHHFNLAVGDNETVDVGPMLSALTLRVSDGTSWEYEHDKSIRIKIELLDFRMIARDGGVEVKLDQRTEKLEGSIIVNNTVEILKTFAEFFHADKWDALSVEFKQNPKKFYEKYIGLFFPATINFGGHLKYTVDGNLITLPGVDGQLSFLTKEVVHFSYDQLNEFPVGDMRMKTTVAHHLVQEQSESTLSIRIDTFEIICIHPAITDKAELAIFQEVVISGITFKFVLEEVNKYIVTKLPFPTDPGVFWAIAIKTMYGDGHLLLGLSEKSNVNHEDGKTMEVGPILCGLITTIGRGHTQQGENSSVYLDLNLLDIKMTNWDGAVKIEQDTSRPVKKGSLTSREPEKIFARFSEFANPANWEELIDEYEESPKRFYEKHVKVFYPAKVVYNMNVLASIGEGKAKVTGYKGATNLVSSKAFSFVCEGVPSFPPASFMFSPSVAVELVDEDTLEKVGGVIAKKKMLWVHPSPEEVSELEICLRTVETGLSFDFVKQMTNTYMTVPQYKKDVKIKFDYVEM